MQAITVRDRAAGAARLTMSDILHPHARRDRRRGRRTLRPAGPRRRHARHDHRTPKVRPDDGRAVFFVVEPDRFRLADLAERVRSGRLDPIIGAVRPLYDVPSAFAPDRRIPAKTIIRVTHGG